MLEEGATWLAEKQWHYTSAEVYYLRGAGSIRLRAMRGQSDFEVTDASGMLTRVDTHDFTVETDELRSDGVLIEPQPGDRIIVGDLANPGQAYEVGGVPGQPVWRWADEYRLRRRIHTKHVGEHP